MKSRFCYAVVLLCLLVSFTTPLFAEKVLDPNANFINVLIKGDTLANGKRADSVYILQRGATYYTQGYIQNIGFPLTLKAAQGNGPLPRIAAWPQTDGTLGARLLDATHDCYLYNIYFDGMGPNVDTGVPDPLFRMGGQLLRAGAAGKALVVDGCILNNCGQVMVRSNSGARLLKFTNTVFANMGQVSADNLGNGRVVDFRDGATDTLIMRNCTVINGADRILRHRDATNKQNFLQYVEIDHCTFVHWLGAFGMLHMGDLGASGLKLTNNLFVNPMAFGYSTTDEWRRAEFDLHGEKDANGIPIMYMVSDEINATVTPKYEIHHNVLYTEQGVRDIWAQHGVNPVPFVTHRIKSLIGADSSKTHVEADVTLKKIPPFMYDLLNWYYNNPITVAASTTSEHDFNRMSRDFWSDSLDCSYTTDNLAFVGSDGLPVGATVWNSIITAVKVNEAIPEVFALDQNYPNPFNPTTSISYSIASAGKVNLKDFDVSGRAIMTLVDQMQTPGHYQVTFNARQLPSGFYFYTLVKGAERMTKKMLLVK